LEGLAIAGTKEQRLNEDITYDQIRLVSDTGEQLGIVSPDEARTIAEERGMDLVEIAPNAEPPVCRLMDWGKHLYANAKKKARIQEKAKADYGQGSKVQAGNRCWGLRYQGSKSHTLSRCGQQGKGDVAFQGTGNGSSGTRNGDAETG
jgi:hypothetical protein